MARPDLGTKRTCPTTGRKFYDLNKDPVVSPYTGEVLPTAATTESPGPVTGARTKPAEDEEEAAEGTGPELVSLEDVEADEEKAGAGDDDEASGDGDTSDDTFLEEEEEGGNVSDLIEGDLEEDEES